eukprot:TRINITY_DN5678_c0_g1_i2.p1 TRINITY_DN5678_c0_g1~~TRINITY_DN5678_c0_g1_i2.p1  ORF type:complete len:573 (+),score=92.69 TRINITY_DN5678_c0_g1_i2:126-1721(+)
MAKLLAEVGDEEGLDYEEAAAAKKPFLSKDKEGTSFSFFNGQDSQVDTHGESYFSVVQRLRTLLMLGGTPTEDDLQSLHHWQIKLEASPVEAFKQLMNQLRPKMQRFLTTCDTTRVALTAKSRVLAVVDVTQMYYIAYYSCTMVAEASGSIRQLLCGDVTAKPLEPVEFIRSTLPSAKDRRLLRKQYFDQHLRGCKSEWKVYAKCWGTLRKGEGHWIKPKHPNPLLALLRLQLDEWLILWYNSQLWMAEPCNGKAAEKLAKRRQASAREDGFGSGIRAPPPATPVLQEWWDCCRDWPAHLYAYAVPNDAAMQAMLEHCGKIIEIGAGTGYWAAYMQASGISTEAFDVRPPSEGGDNAGNEYHGRTETFVKVDRGGVSAVNNTDAKTLFLCYPPPDTTMAADCLERFKGDMVAYVGEWQGATANEAFEKAILTDFELVQRVELPSFPNQSPFLFIFRRRSSAASSIWSPLVDGHHAKVWRCRYDRQTVITNPEDGLRLQSAHLHRLRRKGIFLNREDLLGNDVEGSRHWTMC